MGGGQDGRRDRAAGFWIARFPITVAQYRVFIGASGYNNRDHWTADGWKWKGKRAQPWGWDESPWDGANQPVIGVIWYEATAFAAWLTAQVQDALPPGYALRLPTEAEWEGAAAYDVQRQRRTYPWGEEEPNVEHAIYDAYGIEHPAPVGCCPAGAAACGALDMAGNVWEVATSSWAEYPAQSEWIQKDFTPDEGDVPYPPQSAKAWPCHRLLHLAVLFISSAALVATDPVKERRSARMV